MSDVERLAIEAFRSEFVWAVVGASQDSERSSISRPPRITKPFFGSFIPSSAPPGSWCCSRRVIRLHGIRPSRIRKAAPASAARPEPTNHAWAGGGLVVAPGVVQQSLHCPVRSLPDATLPLEAKR
jgi:hypothetical protein